MPKSCQISIRSKRIKGESSSISEVYQKVDHCARWLPNNKYIDSRNISHYGDTLPTTFSISSFIYTEKNLVR